MRDLFVAACDTEKGSPDEEKGITLRHGESRVKKDRCRGWLAWAWSPTTQLNHAGCIRQFSHILLATALGERVSIQV